MLTTDSICRIILVKEEPENECVSSQVQSQHFEQQEAVVQYWFDDTVKDDEVVENDDEVVQYWSDEAVENTEEVVGNVSTTM